jgi:histidinol-phosphate phosphatase family protein
VPTSSAGPPERRRKALFVDRDGTLNPDLHYLREADRLELFGGVGAALALAHQHGYLIVCVTNQSGIARGFYTREEVEKIHLRVNERLRPSGVQVDAFYYCPHAPGASCRCRKPATGLFEDAARDLRIDFGRSAILGDRPLDVQAGEKLGLLTGLVVPPGLDDRLREESRASGTHPDLLASSLRGAVLRVLARG